MATTPVLEKSGDEFCKRCQDGIKPVLIFCAGLNVEEFHKMVSDATAKIYDPLAALSRSWPAIEQIVPQASCYGDIAEVKRPSPNVRPYKSDDMDDIDVLE